MSMAKDQSILIKIARLYYEDNLSQKEISAQLGISRPQISRLLTLAREENIVTVRINDPNFEETMVERELMRRYSLTDVLVRSTKGLEDESRLDLFGRMAGSYLESYIDNDDRVGVMGGKTISGLIGSMLDFSRRNLHIVPLMGGFGVYHADWHANSIAQVFAKRCNGSCYILNAPAFLQSAYAKKTLCAEPEIKSVLAMGEHCNASLVGINSIDSLAIGGILPDDIDALKKAGAVASVCASYIGKNGAVVQTPVDERMIGKTLKDIAGSKIIAAAIGDHKTAAICAVLASGRLHGLITDLDTAKKILYIN